MTRAVMLWGSKERFCRLALIAQEITMAFLVAQDSAPGKFVLSFFIMLIGN
jgi:hypothetical protein